MILQITFTSMSENIEQYDIITIINKCSYNINIHESIKNLLYALIIYNFKVYNMCLLL